jgi:pyruvate ferredoxin oxidoreductase gamma subunit/2-oxoisovalerate ferredoxin oxidoreductase gamma subunit
LDRTLLQGIDVTQGLKTGGWILINAPHDSENPETLKGYRLAFVDATRIALKYQLGTRTHPIVNTAMMGAFARVFGMPPMEAIVKAIEEEVPTKPEQNIRAAKDAYEEVQIIDYDYRYNYRT